MTFLRVIPDSTSNLSIESILVNDTTGFNGYRFVFFLAIGQTIVVLIIAAKEKEIKKKLHSYFFVVAAILGTAIIALQPKTTFYSMDDQIHFERVISLFGGGTYTKAEEALMRVDRAEQNGTINVTSLEEGLSENRYYDELDKLKAKKVIPKGRIFDFTYLCNLPSAIGYRLAKLLGASFVVAFIAGKAANLLLYLLVGSLIIKKSRFGKAIIATILLIPTNLFLACQYSYDPVVLIGVMALIAYIANILLSNDEKVKFRGLLATIVIFSLACSAKAIYAPLAILLLLIPKNRFASSKVCKRTKIGIVTFVALMLSSFMLPLVAAPDTMADARGGDTSVSRQISNIIHDPIDFASILYTSAIKEMPRMLLAPKALGSYGYVGTISESVCFLIVVQLAIVAFVYSEGGKMRLKHRLFIAAVIICVYFAIWGALYLAFCEVGSDTIYGVQNRYFLPLFLPISLCARSIKTKAANWHNVALLAMSSLIIVISLLRLLLIRFCL